MGMKQRKEIASVLSNFNPESDRIDILKIETLAINMIMKSADNLATKVKEGKSILHEIFDLKIFQRFLIEIYFSTAKELQHLKFVFFC